jgi:hypothetical protein
MRRPAGIVTRSYSAAAVRPSPHVAAPAAVATAAPTPQFRQHHQVETPRVDSTAFRQGWLVATRLDQLLETGAINREAWGAARTWRRWVETTAPIRAQAWDVRVDRSLAANDTAMLHRVAAATRLRACAEALGPLRCRLLELHVTRDASWREIAARAGVSDKTARSLLIEALEALADHCAGRAVAAPPLLRFRNQPGSL